MKAQILLLLFLTTIGQGWAMKNKDNNPIIGSWKYTRQSEVNDFQQVINASPKQVHVVEYFVFEPNNRFKHQFINDKGEVVKTLTGKWRSIGDKINIQYKEIDYSVNVDYFFLDKDLVLGQNFNHVIFTKEEKDLNDNGNMAMK